MKTSDWLLIGIIAFVLIDFAAGRVINFLNEKSKNQPLGPEAADIYGCCPCGGLPGGNTREGEDI